MINFTKAITSKTTKTFKNPPPTSSRFNIFKYLSLLAMVLMLGVNGVMGQSNPTAFALSGGSFTFTSQTASNTTYPTNMQGHSFAAEPAAADRRRRRGAGTSCARAGPCGLPQAREGWRKQDGREDVNPHVKRVHCED